MSAAFPRGKSGNLSIFVPMREGTSIQRSTGTKDLRVVRGMRRACTRVKDERRWTLTDAIRANRITLGQLYDAYVANDLDGLERRLKAVNLADHLDGWIAWVKGTRRADVRTPEVYWQQVTTLIVPGTPFLATDLTKRRVHEWLQSRDKATSGTKRKYLAALRSFVKYLLQHEYLDADPIAGIVAPKKNPARERWESAEVDQRIVDAAMPKYRALFAFIKATGADVSVALKTQRGDVDLAKGTVNLRGTKTPGRKVHRATIEPWALPYLTAHCKGIVSRHALLFTGMTRFGPSSHHATCCTAVGVEDYTLKDSRHSVAMRMLERGATYKQIGRQLGTSVSQVVNVYTKYEKDAETDGNTTADTTRRNA